MFIQLPSGLHEDEPLYSALARSGDALPPRSSRDLLWAAFGGRTMVATMDLPARLDAVGSRLLCMRGCDAPGLVLLTGHTLFPYYAFSVEPEVARRAAALMRGGGGGVVHGLLGVRASRVPAPSRLRYCPRCVELDWEAQGCAWWRRTHQLPGVLVCPGHAVPLLESRRLTSSARDRLAFHSLERSMTTDDQPCAPAGLTERAMACMVSLAERSARILTTSSADGIGIGVDALWRTREAALRVSGFGWGSRRIAVHRLRDALAETLGTDVLALCGCLPGSKSADDWVARMARPPRRSVHPLYHVLVDLLLERLGEDDAELTSASAAPGVAATQGAAPSPEPSATKSGRTVGDAAWDAHLVSLVGSSDLSLRAIARELGVDPLTVQRHAYRLRVWRDAWLCRAQVAPATKAVNKQAKTLADAKARWLALAAIRPLLGRKAMRGRDPAAFALLHRRDRKWLDQHSPPPASARPHPSAVDWAARDARVAAELEDAAAGLLSHPRSTRAIRPATIARAADRLALVQQQAARMPLSAVVLARRSQDPKALARERLERAVAEWPAEARSSPAASVLTKAAGLNPSRTDQLQGEIAAALVRLAASPH